MLQGAIYLTVISSASAADPSVYILFNVKYGFGDALVLNLKHNFAAELMSKRSICWILDFVCVCFVHPLVTIRFLVGGVLY